MSLILEDFEYEVTHEEFIELTESIIENESKESPYDNPDYFNFTKVNLRRYKSFEKKVELNEELVNEIQEGTKGWTMVLLNEPWCSDGSFGQPVINKIAEASNGNISLKILLRDKNPKVMDQFLTNGGKAIPKLVVLNEENEVLGSWGPRPAVLAEIVKELIAGSTMTLNDKIVASNRWYMKDKGQELQKELLQLVRSWKQVKEAV